MLNSAVIIDKNKNVNKLDIKTILIVLVSFFGELMNICVYMGLVYLLKLRFSLDAQNIGIIMSLNTFSYLTCCLLFMKLSEKLAPRHCVEFSFLIQFITVFGLLFSKTLLPIYFLQIIYGGSRAFFWPPISGWLNRGKEGSDLSRSHSLFNLSWSLGGGLGPVVAGIFIGKNLILPFIIGAFVYLLILISIIVVSLTHHEIRADKSENDNIKINGLKDNSTMLRYYSWIGLFLVYIASQTIITIFPLHAMDSLNLTPEQSGFLITVKGIIATLFFVSLGKMHWWQFKKELIIGSQVSLAILCLLSTKIESTFFIGIFFALIGFHFALMYEMSLFHGMSGAVNKTRRMTIHEVVLTAGMVIGNVVGGTIYRSYGFNSIMLWLFRLAVIVVIVEILFSIFYKKKN